MDTVYLVVIGALLVGVLVLLAMFKRDWLVKGWKYIAGAAVALVALFFAFGRRRSEPDPGIQEEIKQKREELQKNLEEVRQEGQVEVDQAKAKEQEIVEELHEIEEIQDEEEKLNRLEELFNKTRRR
jgi:membrane protein implicated in regulation of membrane protease activity